MKEEITARRITDDPLFHFKAYYDIQPWNSTANYFLCMESSFNDKPQTADDALTVGIVDLESGNFEPLATTKAWNFQQGCMPHWLETAPDKEIVYNDRIDNAFRSVVMDIHTGKQRVLPRAIQAVAPDGRKGACLNYSRWGNWRPGYGYQGIPDPFCSIPDPREDAVYLMDLGSGDNKPLVCLGDIADLTSERDKRKGCFMWFNHLMFNNDGTRLIGLVRWWGGDVLGKGWHQRRHCMWVIDTDGRNLDIIANDALVSHAEWRDPDHIMYWGNRKVGEPMGYMLVNVKTKEHEVIGEQYLKGDGHMSYDSSKQYLLTDTYPDKDSNRTLKIYDIENDREIILGTFYSQPRLEGEIRCDLHPSWNRDCTQVAVQSSHEGDRQVYVVDVGDLTKA